MKHGSLFSGIGGFELGAHWAGIDTIWTCEKDKFARNFLQKKFNKTKHYEDITKLEYPEPVDIVSGGFPCQDISIATRSKTIGVDGNKSGLWRHMSRICSEIKPKYIIIENSPALLSRGFHTILEEFAKIGYDAEWQTLFGHQFGMQQRRRRLYVILYTTSIGNRMEERKVFTGWDKPIYPTWWSAEPKVYGVADVIPDRVHKHRCLGNAVQPLIAHYLFECIKYNEKLINS